MKFFVKFFGILKKVKNSVKFIRWAASLFEFAVESYAKEFNIEDKEEEETQTTEE
jgi:hypothetical protein